MENYFPNVTGTQSQLARERILEDLRILIADAEMLLNATVGEVSEKASEARERLKAALARARITLTELQQKGLASVQAAANKADVTIRDHPYESVGIALGVGFLIGLVLGRR
jgi:ElaB/YqjD/DUF883 family membrane-anchored ribosome-binding protein